MATRKIVPVLMTLAFTALSGCDRLNSPKAKDNRWSLHKAVGPVFTSPTKVRIIEEVFFVPNPSAEEQMVLILKAQSCGSCMEVNADPSRVPVRGEAKITIRTTLPNETGARQLTATYETGLKVRPWLQIGLQVNTVALLEVLPKEPPLLKISGGEAARTSLEVICHDLTDTNGLPIEADCSDPSIKVECTESERSESDRVRKVKHAALIFIPPCTGGEAPAGGKALIRVRRGVETVQREVHWRRVWPITANPQEVFIHAVSFGKSERSVRLQGDRPFVVTGLASSAEYLTVAALTKGSAIEHDLRIACGPPRDNEQAASASVVIKTDHPVQPEIRIPVNILWRKKAT